MTNLLKVDNKVPKMSSVEDRMPKMSLVEDKIPSAYGKIKEDEAYVYVAENISLSGATQNLSMGTLAFGTGQFTFETWININGSQSLANRGDYIRWGGANPYPWIRITYFGVSGFRVSCSDGTKIPVAYFGTTPPANEWIHLALSRPGSVAFLYQNATLLGTVTGLGTIGAIDGASNSLGIFDSGWTGTAPLGKFREFRLWNIGLAATDITTHSNDSISLDVSNTAGATSANLMVHWKCKEGGGTTLADASGNGRTGSATYTGGLNWQAIKLYEIF